MKTAGPELVTLLAGSRQFVMWETFIFTLPGGTEIVYSTLDPDAPPQRAASGGGGTDPDPVELPGENGSIETAQPVPALPMTISGSLGGQDIDDFYAVVLAPGNLLSATLTPPAEADFDLYLFDAQGVQRAGSEKGTGAIDDIEFAHNGSGLATVYVNVKLFNGSGPYTLDLSVSLLPPPPPPPPPTPPPPSLPARGNPWLRDTFTGPQGDALVQHVGEIGAAWGFGEGGYPSGPEGLRLDGTGALRVSPNGTQAQARASGTPPADLSNIYLDMVCVLGAGAVMELSCKQWPAFVGPSAELNSFGATIDVQMFTSTATQNLFNRVLTGIPSTEGRQLFFSIEITNGRRTVTFKLDGVTLATHALTAALPQPTAVDVMCFSPDAATAIFGIEGGQLL